MKILNPEQVGAGGRRSSRRTRALLMALVLGCGVLTMTGLSPSSAVPSCFGRQPTIVGDGSDETLRGTPQTDVILARGGDDTIRGRNGKDFICGNRGEDVINGGGAADKMNGHQDIDYLAGNAGDDKMLGGGAGDELHGNIGRPSDNDVAKGSKGPDFIDVADSRGNDSAAGGAGADTCVTDPGDSESSC
jgi:Ca2+-binding RTX toxin-like protein